MKTVAFIFNDRLEIIALVKFKHWKPSRAAKYMIGVLEWYELNMQDKKRLSDLTLKHNIIFCR